MARRGGGHAGRPHLYQVSDFITFLATEIVASARQVPSLAWRNLEAAQREDGSRGMGKGAAPDRPTGQQTARSPRQQKRYWRTRFLDELARGATVAMALAASGCPSSTAYAHRSRDPDFAKAWDDADEQGMAMVESEIVRRGVDGWDEPHFYEGQIAGYVRRYDSRLLLRLAEMKNRRWSQRHAVDHTHTGRIEHAVAVIPCDGRNPALCTTCQGKGCPAALAHAATAPVIEHDPAPAMPAPAPVSTASPDRPAVSPARQSIGKRTR